MEFCEQHKMAPIPTSPKPMARIGSLFAAAQGFNLVRQRSRRKYSHGSSPNCSLSVDDHLQPARRITSKHSQRGLELEDFQLTELSQHFSNISDKYSLFESMFLQLFANDPQVAFVFGMDGISDVELRRMTPFRTHVCKFQRFITTVMDLLPKVGREEELIHIIRMVGRQHTNSKTFSFTAARWLSFKSALMTIFSKNEKDKLNSSWSVLFSFIILEMKDAYLSHIRHIRSSSLPLVDHELYRLDFKKITISSQNGICEKNAK